MHTTSDKKLIEVCYTPGQYPLYEGKFDLVVVIDVLRATSAITTALHYGVEKIIPVGTVEEARAFKAKGYITAAERDGQVVEGFDFGNSPYAFMDEKMKGKTVVLTTTNGTRAIQLAASKCTVVMGCLNNLDFLCQWLIERHENTLVLASGWKDKVNLEDTICGGAIANTLLETRRFRSNEDSTVAAKFIYRSAREHLLSFLRASSHRRRLIQLNIQQDVKYCLTLNTVPCIPVLKDGVLVRLDYHPVNTEYAIKTPFSSHSN
ncbi:MAG: 2-phosphosulfolactate phosphatase [Crocinitomicaceae bacterium]|nr:2-phosphosulfolactate phosphatase [Crocinitomicaceae bacterium]